MNDSNDSESEGEVQGVAGQNMTALPRHYLPGEWDVICKLMPAFGAL
jgi:hypothetical protein